MGRRPKISDEQRDRTSKAEIERVTADLKKIGDTILPDDWAVVGVGGIHAALAEAKINSPGLNLPRADSSRLWAIAAEIEAHSYVQTHEGLRTSMVSSVVNDATVLMPAAASERRASHDWQTYGAMGGRPKKAV